MGAFNKDNFIDAAYDKYRGISTGTAEFKNNTTVGDTDMQGNMVKRTVNANTDAAKVAAAITAGRTINNVVTAKVVPKLPMLVKGYADTPLGRVVMANVIDFAVKQYMPTNRKANYASDAAMQAAMVDFLADFDIEGMLEDVLNSVTMPEEVKD